MAVLTEQRGEFGSNYDNEESCRWRISVNQGQVNLHYNHFVSLGNSFAHNGFSISLNCLSY